VGLILPFFGVDNHLSVTQYSDVALLGYENGVAQTAGLEFRVADGRRSPGGWTGISTNVEYILKWTNGRQRGADYCAIDRGHNLSRLIYEVSDDDFTGLPQLVFDITFPTASMTGAVDDPFGVRTEEAAWIKAFGFRAFKYGRFRIPAMGVGLKPMFRAYTGLSYRRARYDLPFIDDRNHLNVQEWTTPAGVRGRGQAAVSRQGQIDFQMTLESLEYPTFRDHIINKFGGDFGKVGSPMWIIHDDQQADRAVLTMRAGGGEIGSIVTGERLTQRIGSLTWVEHDPKKN